MRPTKVLGSRVVKNGERDYIIELWENGSLIMKELGDEREIIWFPEIDNRALSLMGGPNYIYAFNEKEEQLRIFEQYGIDLEEFLREDLIYKEGKFS